MTISIKVENQLNKLRKSAAVYDWETCDEVVQQLLEELELHKSLQIVLYQLERYLPIFERDYPQVSWPRKGIEFAGQFGVVEYPIASYLSEQEPVENREWIGNLGAITFTDAIFVWDDAHAAYLKHYRETSIELMTSALSWAIMASLYDYHSRECPQIWERVMQAHHKQDQTAFDDAKKVYDECTREYRATLWQRLTDDVEKRLAHSTTVS